MAAPEGNQFWKLRSKHGRDKLFSSPEELWNAACDYFKDCEENPFIEIKPMVVSAGNNTGSSVEMVPVPKIRPFTWDGLEIFLDIDRLRHYKTDTNYQDFLPVIERIGKIIYNQKFSGAASGFFNANIIARDLGLADKKDVEKRVVKLRFKDAE